MSSSLIKSRQGRGLAPLPLIGLLALCLLFATGARAPRCTPPGECLLGVFPHTGMDQLQATYKALAEDLSIVLDTDVRLVSSSSMQRFRRQIEQGRWDITLLDPVQFVRFAETAGYRPLATTERRVAFQIVTLDRTHIRHLRQLRGRRVGTMGPDTASWLIGLELLHNAGLDPGRDLRIRTYASERTCLYALLARLVEACSLARPVFDVLRLKQPADYHVLGESPARAGAVYAVHTEVPEAQRRRIRDYLSSRPGMRVAMTTDWDSYRAVARELDLEERP